MSPPYRIKSISRCCQFGWYYPLEDDGARESGAERKIKRIC